jgi:fructose-1,6-bisphosphatase/inositol monophosphatase family enzyme
MQFGVIALEAAHKSIVDQISDAPEFRFERTPHGGIEKLVLDIVAERNFRRDILTVSNKKILTVGEESLHFGSNFEKNKVYVLADILDGTDLWEMDIPLWCVSAIFFETHTNKIIGSVVINATGDVYRADQTEVSVSRKMTGAYDGLYADKSPRDFNNARICFYGQKANRLAGITSNKDVIEGLVSLEKSRFYNFAGNPMMVKLVDKTRDTSGKAYGGVNCIIETVGQKPHDVAPGAYIAIRAGATMIDLDNCSLIKEDDLFQKIVQPTQTMRYILAENEDFAREMAKRLGYLSCENSV